MASVPDTTTFTFQNVKSVVAGSPNDLVAAFAAATDAYFDPAYKGSKDNLLNFRNYTTAAPNTLSVDSTYLEIEGNAQSYLVAVTSNTDWEVTEPVDAGWLTLAFTTGSGNGNFGYTVTANNTGSNRDVTLRLETTSGAPTQTIFIIVEQEPRD